MQKWKYLTIEVDLEEYRVFFMHTMREYREKE